MHTKPFLKWAGGKFRLLDTILQTLPPGRRLVEPFMGSGAVFLNADYPAYLICDSNPDLIALFQHVQREGDSYIARCKSLFCPPTNTPESYYALRERFNTSTDSAERGALLLYLNRHSFNGLVRYNSKGRYNVPFGRYKKPYFPQQELQHCYARSQACDTVFTAQDFSATFAALQAGDVLYADPPYIPLSATAHFTSYAGTHFAEAQQQHLADLARAAWQKGVSVILSNHDTPFTRKLYAEAQLQHFTVQRSISCHGATRGKVPELLAAYLS